ncbi:MerR family transcriptional regulator [Bradyrhizobium sp. SRL28]|uniref:MerR family transcriptional regulator n=1 Tax=Bradyrhizobium sp. SRL28 TaxID=2836178 RepID=UPI001BDE3C01|nr:MerR family transcriptional regulator [Bradyrhizobium sp. SRL28]MBT1516743.1 MerR family transcriptional regulator [Bradyrhizobium sp. SRL28]
MTRPTPQRRRLRRIGEVAEATGVTIRTLRHYEDTGLLAASQRTCGGHRLYDCESVRRVSHIRALREVGCSILDIRKAIERKTALSEFLKKQLKRAELQVERATLTRDRLREMVLNPETDVTIDQLPGRLDAISDQSTHVQTRRRLRGEDTD